MSEKKPNVFPKNNSSDMINQANENGTRIARQYEEENRERISKGDYSGTISSGEESAALQMKKNTEEQIRIREEKLKQDQLKAEEIDRRFTKKKESEKPSTNPNPYAYGDEANYVENSTNMRSSDVVERQVAPTQYTKEEKVVDYDPYIEKISQPQMNQAFDVIPLPSRGKTYPNKKKSVKVAYLTTADENILTSPNLIESGDFLEILINRKLLEPGLRYKDLHTGDRNAIMIWLRATGYGEKYPIQVTDKNGIPFDTIVDLNELKTVELEADPDSEGLFDFKMPLSGTQLKIKLLNVGEVEAIEKLIEDDKDSGQLINNENTYVLESQIVEVDGNRDKGFISEYVKNIRTLEVQKLRAFVQTLECGIDLRIDVKTPGGGSIKTFLPLNLNFFWPDTIL